MNEPNELQITPEAQNCAAYADSARAFVMAIQQATALSKATDLSEAEKGRFTSLADAITQRAVRELHPHYRPMINECKTVQ